jgi:hypothetical protein
VDPDAAMKVGVAVTTGVVMGGPDVMDTYRHTGADDVALPERGAHPEGGRAKGGEHRHRTQKSATGHHQLKTTQSARWSRPRQRTYRRLRANTSVPSSVIGGRPRKTCAQSASRRAPAPGTGSRRYVTALPWRDRSSDTTERPDVRPRAGRSPAIAPSPATGRDCDAPSSTACRPAVAHSWRVGSGGC